MARKQPCADCHQRPAKFRVKRGPVKQDGKHTLCSECYRNLCNSFRVKSDIPSPPSSRHSLIPDPVFGD